MKKSSQDGFGHLGLFLLLAVTAIIALAGYKVANNQSAANQVNNTAAPTTAQTIPTIKSAADLNSAETTLNSQNVDGDLNPDSLNSDVTSLL